MYKIFGKRILDLTLAFCILLPVLPLLLLISSGLFLLNGKVFFIQYRPGYKAKLFPLIKFRTLDERDPARAVLLGSFLRRTGLDELPQLLNVLAGHMSLVGPRPLLEKYLSLYSPENARRMDIRPGMTGLVQISGRNRLSWQEKFSLDRYYLENLSFRLDLTILLKTFFILLKADKEEASVAGEFTGSE